MTFARTHGLPLAVRGGGHNVAGHATVDDGIVLDLAALSAVTLDAAAREVTVGVRASFGDRYERLAAVKARWDPENLFHLNQNVRPRAAAQDARPQGD